MGNIVRIRVEMNPKEEDKEIARRMHIAFKNAYKDSGIAHTAKRYETYESKSRKKRRKQRESEIMRMKAKLKDNFLQGKNK